MSEILNGLWGIFYQVVNWFITILVAPLNAMCIELFPNLSANISSAINSFMGVFNGMSWGLGIIPNNILTTLLLILTLEIVKYTITMSIYYLRLVFKILSRYHDKIGWLIGV